MDCSCKQDKNFSILTDSITIGIELEARSTKLSRSDHYRTSTLSLDFHRGFERSTCLSASSRTNFRPFYTTDGALRTARPRRYRRAGAVIYFYTVYPDSLAHPAVSQDLKLYLMWRAVERTVPRHRIMKTIQIYTNIYLWAVSWQWMQISDASAKLLSFFDISMP